MGSNEGHVWMSLGGVGHVELSEGFFGLTPGISPVWGNVDPRFVIIFYN